jgi:hypothetical protein
MDDTAHILFFISGAPILTCHLPSLIKLYTQLIIQPIIFMIYELTDGGHM